MEPVGTRILAVEDDERIREAVKLALEDEGWTVERRGVGRGGDRGCSTAQPPDVVLIDIMLPGIDGFELCRTIRRTSDVPIVMVTARNDTHDVVAGLEAGADDYLTKPFAPKELSARIRALLRRIRPAQLGHERLVFGDLEIIPEEGKVLQGGEEVHLTKTEFRLLCELALEPRQGVQPRGAARPGLGVRLLRRRPPRRRAHPPPAHEGRGRPGQPAPRRHRARARVPAPGREHGTADRARQVTVPSRRSRRRRCREHGRRRPSARPRAAGSACCRGRPGRSACAAASC